MTSTPRVGALEDLGACLGLRSAWLDRFCEAHSPEERWCPAGVPVPRIEAEEMLRDHLAQREGDRWAAVLSSHGEAHGYMLCRTDNAKSELSIEGHYPRVSSRAQLEEAGSELLQFVIRRSGELGPQRVRALLHGFPDEVDPLADLYHKHGFGCHPRVEMLSRQLLVDPGSQHLRFRSAEEIGLDAFFESEAATGYMNSAEDSKQDCEFSQKMWGSVEPSRDWLVAYQGESLVGTVRVAVTRKGVGVLDGIAIVKEHRGRGLGRCLLARGLSSLVGRTELVWADVDHDNVPALRLYRRAGFQVHHHHGEVTMELASA